jgi:hypothetical protein
MAKVGDGYVEVKPDLDAFATRLRAALTGVDGKKEGQRVGQRVNQGFANAMKSGIGAATGKTGVLVGLAATMAGPLASTISGLSASVVSLGSSLGYASSQGAMLPGIMASLGQGFVTGKIAAIGMGDAFKALAKQQEEIATEGKASEETLAATKAAMKNLSPEARDLTKAIWSQRKGFDGLRKSVQDAVFKDLGDSVRSLSKSYLPLLEKGLTATGKVLNGLGKDFAKMAASGGRMRDFSTFLKGNNVILRNIGRAGLIAFDGIRHVIMALLPSTQKFSGSILDVAKGFRSWAKEARKSGKLADFMEEARKSGSLLWKIVKNVGSALASTFGAGKRQGDSMLKGIEKLTRQWADWSKSLTGQNKLKAWFDEGREVGHELWLLIRDIGESFGNLSKSTDSSDFVRSIRVDLVRPLLKMIESLNKKGVGADLVKTLGELLRTLNQMGLGGTISSFLSAINAVLRPIATLVRTVPGATDALGALLGVYVAFKVSRVFSTIASGIGGVATNARTAASNVTTLTTNLRNGTGGLSAYNQALSGIRTAARGAAGVGGVMALSGAAQTTSKKMQVLGSAAGGALLGFSVGGPIGAAIGGGAGALAGLMMSTRDASDAMTPAKAKAEEYAAAIDRIARASGRAQRAEALSLLQKDGMVQVGNQLGISTRTLIAATLGNAHAQGRIRRAYQNTTSVAEGLTRGKLNAWLIEQGWAIRQARQEVEDENNALKRYRGGTGAAARSTQEWNKALKGLPKGVKVQLKNANYKVTTKEVADLAKRYKQNPKKLTTKLELAGVKVVQKGAMTAQKAARKAWAAMREGKGVRPHTGKWTEFLLGDVGKAQKGTERGTGNVRKNLEGVGKSKANLGPFTKGVVNALRSMTRDADRGVQQMVRSLRSGTAKAKPDLGPFGADLGAGMNRLMGQANTGGNQIGSNLKSGVLSGFAGTATQLANEAASAVNQAIAAARAAAKAKSPSRRTMQLGHDMARGMAIGMRKGSGEGKREAKGFVARMVKALMDGGKAYTRLWSKVTKTIRTRWNEKDEKKRQKAELKHVAELQKRWTKANRARVKLAAKIANAENKLKDALAAQAEYARSTTEAGQNFASILGANLPTGASSEQFLLDMERRTDELARFAANVAKLRNSGLNKRTLREIIDAGAEQGGVAAQALVTGGAAAIKGANALQQRVNEIAGGIGKSASKDFYGAGVDAAEGLVSGLQSKMRKVRRTLHNMATTMARALKRRLGIKSPSTVFAGIGDNTALGFTKGVERRQRDAHAAIDGLISQPGRIGVPRGHLTRGLPEKNEEEHTYVRVFIGDTELTNIVRTEVRKGNRDVAKRLNRGRKVVT